MREDIRNLRERILTRPQSSPLGERFTRPARWLWVISRALRRDYAYQRAAGMAYTTLLALVPALVLIFGIVNALGGMDELRQDLLTFIGRQFLADMPEVKDLILPGLESANLNAIGIIGIIGLLTVAMRLYMQVEVAYCEIFKARKPRPFLQRLARFYVAFTLLPLVLTRAGFSLVQFVQGMGLAAAQEFTIASVEFLVLLVANKTLPNRRVRFFPAALGAMVSLILLRIANAGFKQYVTLFSGQDALSIIYGSLGALPFFLLWLYLIWLSILLGVEVAAVQQDYRSIEEAELDAAFGDNTRVGGVGLDVVLAMVLTIAERYAAGQGPTSTSTLDKLLTLPETASDPIAEILCQAKILVGTEQGWTLSRPPETITLREVADTWREHTNPKSHIPSKNDALWRALTVSLDLNLLEAQTRFATHHEDAPSS